MKMKKLFTMVLTVAMVATMALSLTGCQSEPSAAESTGIYLSNNNLTYSNMLPTYNYFSASAIGQSLETFSDSTYCLTVNRITFSNISLGPDVPTGEETWNDRGQTVQKYYGTFTEEADSESRIITLGKPSRVEYGSFGIPYLNSATATTEDTIPQSQGDPIPATDYLNDMLNNFPADTTVMVSLGSGTFDQVSMD